MDDSRATSTNGKANPSPSDAATRRDGHGVITSWLLHHQSAILVTLYVIVTALCYFMVLWILVFPGVMFHDSFPKYKESVMEILVKESPFDVDMSTKYHGQTVVHFLHLIPGVVWSVVAPLQLHTNFRKKNWRLHRWLGYALFACIPFQMAGVYVIKQRGLTVAQRYADVTANRWVAMMPWVDSLAALHYTWTAIMALYHVKQGNYLDHRLYMIRHVALGSFVSLMRIITCFFPAALPRHAQLDLFAYSAYASIALTTLGGELACYLYEATKREKQKKL